MTVVPGDGIIIGEMPAPVSEWHRTRASAIWRLVLALIAVLPADRAARAQQPEPPVLGRWLDEAKDGAIEVFPCAAGALCWRLVWFLLAPEDVGKPPLDEHNPVPALRDRPMCGLVILSGFRPSGDREWGDGRIYDPDNGKTYHGTMTLAPNDTLRLRGYIGIPLFGGTEVWTRAAPRLGSCEGLADP